MLGTAPWVDSTLELLKDTPSYTNPKIHNLLLEIFRAMGHSEPVSEDNIAHIGIEVPRGTPDDYDDPYVLIDEGIVEDYDEFERIWMDKYPDEAKWYEITATQHKDVKYIYINNDLVFKFKDLIDKNMVREFEDDCVYPFLLWILAVIKMDSDPDHEITGLKDLFDIEVLAHYRQTAEKAAQVLWEITGLGRIKYN